ncbi:MAG: hypothetical protein AAFU67_10805 [Bacteroidota bacterium]
MRNRIVVWGRNAQEERVLIALELLIEQNIVKLQTFAEKEVTDEVYKIFMDQWRKNAEAEIPDPQKVWARELSVSEDLLPEELKVEQSDMINRAQTEWHYLVLSDKLKQAYNAELAEINDRVERAEKYDSNLWGQLKSFWEKVQQQLKDKTLLREHGNEIRKSVDDLFTRLKELRDKLNEEIKEKSAATVSQFAAELEGIEKRIEEGTHLRRVFDDLRKLQSKFHNVTFSRDDRKVVYDRIDKAFKAVKAKRGSAEEQGGAMARLQARYDGLMKAIEKMERSIGRDEKDLQFEHRRIANTDGQLEAQIRQAKIKMIESRIESKREKLEDMNKTKGMLEGRIAKQQKRVEKEQKRQAEREAAEAVKAKIAAEVKAGQSDLSPAEKAKLKAAASAIKEGKESRKKDAKPVADNANKLVDDAVAASEILFPHHQGPNLAPPPVSESTENIEATAAVELTPPTPESSDSTEEKSLLEKAGEFLEDIGEKVEDALEDAVDTAKAVAQVAGEKLEMYSGIVK